MFLPKRLSAVLIVSFFAAAPETVLAAESSLLPAWLTGSNTELSADGGTAEPTAVEGEEGVKRFMPSDMSRKYIVGKISIRPFNIFDTGKEEFNSWPYRLVNSAHIVTADDVIGRELLQRPGDTYSPREWYETERNLRRRRYITDAVIVPLFNNDGTVDIDVVTHDAWTLILGGTVGGTGDNTVAGVDIGEQNLLGRGISAVVRTRKDNSGLSSSYSFDDYRFFNLPVQVTTSYQDQPVQDGLDLTVQKPFYSLEDKWSMGGTFARERKFGDFDSANIKKIEYNREKFFLVRSFSGAEHYGPLGGFFAKDTLVRPGLAVLAGELTSFRNDGRSKTYDNNVETTLQLLTSSHKYVTTKYVNKFNRNEDFFLGWDATLKFGAVAAAWAEKFSRISYTVDLRKNWFGFGDSGRDLALLAIQARAYDEKFNESYYTLDCTWHYRWFTNQDLVFHIKAASATGDLTVFKLGGNNGLRGYISDAFSGNKMLQLNFEHRYFTMEEMLFHLVEPGFAWFVDAGRAWQHDEQPNPGQIRAGIGVGLRFALLAAPGLDMIRIDYGFPADFRGPPVFSIGTAMLF